MSARPDWGELVIGDKAPERRIGPISRTDVVRYQGASGDMNPVHHDEPFAIAAGYAVPLVVGMYPAGALSVIAAEWLGPDCVRRVKVRWRAQVWPGDVLVLSAAIARKYEENAEKKVDVDLVCAKEGGEIVVLGWMTFVMP